jgi:hypothetical protein
MLFFELFPAFIMVVAFVAGIGLLIADRQAADESEVDTSTDRH